MLLLMFFRNTNHIYGFGINLFYEQIDISTTVKRNHNKTTVFCKLVLASKQLTLCLPNLHQTCFILTQNTVYEG